MSFAVKYFRHPKVVEAYAAAGIDKPAGFVLGLDRFNDSREAAKLAAHLNGRYPPGVSFVSAIVVPSKQSSTHACFIPPKHRDSEREND